MFKKLVLLAVAVAACLISSAQAATIIYVSDNKTPDAAGIPADQAWVDLLIAQGYTVDLSFRNKEARTLDATKIAALNAADLIIVSRDSNSGDYDDGSEPTQWNSITTPLILQVSIIAQNNRWHWLNTSANTGAQPPLEVMVPSHPIFKGVTLDANNQVTMLTSSSSLSNASDAGNGTLLGKRSDNSQVWIAEWQPGVEFYSGAGQTPAGHRMLCTCGGGTPDGRYNLTPEGEKIFLNAVRYMLGDAGDAGKAIDPIPADAQTDVPRDVTLSWTPGKYAAAANGHTVYFSENFNDVNDGKGGIRQSNASYTPPQRLNFETTYYWRVDEVNAPPSSAVHKGNVWSFTTEPVGYAIPAGSVTATASSSDAGKGPENAVNGSGLDATGLLHSDAGNTMWLSERTGAQPTWIQFEFDKVYKLNKMWVWNSNESLEKAIGLGVKDVTIEYSLDAVSYVALGTQQFAQAPGAPDYAHNTTVDFGGATARFVRLTVAGNWGGLLTQYGLSEVRFFHVPVNAREPNPASGATDVAVDATLSWRAGREAAAHDVFLSSDQQAVIDGTVPAVSVATPSYSAALDLNSTYYWRVDEVNAVETPAIWQGDVWSFSTPEYVVVDNFESYNNIDPPNLESHRIFESWIDGYGVATNGALVGNDPPNPSYAETVIVHGDKQAMPLFYSNTGGATYSEATLTFASPRDWTKHGIKTLSLWFHGAAGNTGQLYVKINGAKIPYDGDAANLAAAAWRAWTIDLTTLGNLQSVRTLAIGIDGNAAAGTLYVDDVRLYAYARQLATPVQPAAAGLMAYYPLDGNANDAAGTANGTVRAGLFAAGKFGQALSLSGAGYVDCGNPSQLDFGTGSWTVSAWVNAPSSTDQMVVFCKGGDNTGGIRYMLSVGEVRDYVVTLTVDNDVTKVESTGSVVADDDQWHHIVGVRDGNSLRVYVDGLQDGAGATLADGYDLSGTSQANAYIGANWHLPNKAVQKYFIGLIDDVRVYNRALSEAEIAGLAGMTKPFDKPF